jgi:hypothetical protein
MIGGLGWHWQCTASSFWDGVRGSRQKPRRNPNLENDHLDEAEAELVATVDGGGFYCLVVLAFRVSIFQLG